MRLLLDTQVVLWAIYRPARLPDRVAKLLAETANDLLLSDASLWEAGIKLAKGKLEYETVLTSLNARLDAFATQTLHITREHIQHAIQLPHHHGDPFDRMLVAQAVMEQVPLVSADEDIRRYNVHVIW